jgi:hypothetical protein
MLLGAASRDDRSEGVLLSCGQLLTQLLERVVHLAERGGLVPPKLLSCVSCAFLRQANCHTTHQRLLGRQLSPAPQGASRTAVRALQRQATGLAPPTYRL